MASIINKVVICVRMRSNLASNRTLSSLKTAVLTAVWTQIGRADVIGNPMSTDFDAISCVFAAVFRLEAVTFGLHLSNSACLSRPLLGFV